MKICWELKGLNLSKTGLESIFWNNSKLLIVDNGEGLLYLIDHKSGKIESSIGVKERINDITVGDINGDSTNEILVIREDGSLLAITHEEIIIPIKAPSALVKAITADIDDDSMDEILAFDSTGTLNVFKLDRIIHRISLTPPIMFYSITDFNNDKRNEFLVLYGHDSYDLYSLESLDLIKHQNIFLGGFKRARVADFDSDSIPEVLILRNKSLISLKPLSGQIEELFELFYDRIFDFEIFDVDNNNRPEIIVLGEKEKKNYVSILSIFGEILVEEVVDKTLTRIYPADINGDGKLECIITSVYGKIVLFDEAGIVEQIDLEKDILSTYINDLDEDGVDEIYIRTKHSVLCLKRF